jgi:ABC-2 type transport system ATP-binding protein
MTDTAAVVTVSNLARRYGEVTALDGVSLEVREGELFGLIGPDGAGKTTLLRTVLGLLAPTSGQVRTLGLVPHEGRRALSARVGYLPQRFSLYGDLTVDENVAFFAEVHGVPRWRPRRDELLGLLRMTPFRKRRADRLSGGMKQKLALACTLIHRPEFLVLDEPTTGVDPVSRRDFWTILTGLLREGMTLFLTTPYLDEAERCSRVALVHCGRILNLDEPRRLRGRKKGSVLEILASPRRTAKALLTGDPRFTEVESFGERLHAFAPVPLEEGARMAETVRNELAARGLAVSGVRAVPPSLEDVFISRVRASDAGKGNAA